MERDEKLEEVRTMLLHKYMRLNLLWKNALADKEGCIHPVAFSITRRNRIESSLD